jgi:hypothetical protein
MLPLIRYKKRETPDTEKEKTMVIEYINQVLDHTVRST